MRGLVRSGMRCSAVVATLALLGCTVPAGGTVELRVSAVDGSLADTYAVDWDGDVTWTREVHCAVGSVGGRTSLHLDVSDRSQGELTLTVAVLAYDGPGDYQRDEFQPTPALTLDWTDPATGETWHLGTDSGGTCAVLVDEGSRSGTASCIDVATFRDQERTDDLASVDVTWTCDGLDRGRDFIATRNRRGRDPSR